MPASAVANICPMRCAATFAQSETGTEARVVTDETDGISNEADAIAQDEITADNSQNSGNTVRFNNETKMFANETARDIFMRLEIEVEGTAP